MVKYYCFYCDVFLSHGSPGVRKSHNNGWKHKSNVREYYTKVIEDMKKNNPQEASILLSYNPMPSATTGSCIPGSQQQQQQQQRLGARLPPGAPLNPLMLARGCKKKKKHLFSSSSSSSL